MSRQKSIIADFTEGSVSKQLLVFSAPLFLSSLLQVVYNMVDMIIVGQATGQTGLAAVAVGGDVSNFLTFFAMGFSNAGQIIISQYIGAKQQDKVGRFTGTMFTFMMGSAVLISAVCLLLREPILQVMNTPEESYADTLAYATVCMAGLIFIYGYNMVGAVLRGMGDSKHPFIFISIAAILNVVLDLLFVMVLHTGPMGAALATVISQAVSFLCSVVFLFHRRQQFGLDVRLRDFLQIDTVMLADLVKLGVPMAIKSAAIQFSKLFVNSWINAYGVTVSAVAGVANKINSISNLFSNAINTAGASMVGQNIGAKKFRRVPKIILTAGTVTFSIAAVLSVLMLFFPRQIFGIFTNAKDVLDIAMEYMPVSILIFFGAASRAPMNALINGSGNYKINFATAIMDGVGMRIGLAMLLGGVLDFGSVGLWMGDALAGFTPFFIGLVYYFSGKWKLGRSGKAAR